MFEIQIMAVNATAIICIQFVQLICVSSGDTNSFLDKLSRRILSIIIAQKMPSKSYLTRLSATWTVIASVPTMNKPLQHETDVFYRNLLQNQYNALITIDDTIRRKAIGIYNLYASTDSLSPN